MKTQPLDTHPDIERMLVHLIRNAPVSKRFRLIQSLTQGTLWSNIQAWRERHPDMGEQEAAVEVISCWYGPILAARVQMALAQREQWSLQPIDLLTVVLPALHLFEERNAFCYLGGSIASSIYGMQQMAQDIDLVVDLDGQDLTSLLSLLKQVYVFDEDAFQEAVCRRTTCSLIHLDTLMKVDLIPLKRRAFTREEARRAQPQVLEAGTPPLKVATAEDAILTKLEWF